MTLAACWRVIAAWAAGGVPPAPAVHAHPVHAFIDASARTIARTIARPDAPAVAAAAHAQDRDEYDATAIGRPSAALVPTSLALPTLSGALAIDAIPIRHAAMIRLDEIVNPANRDGGWRATLCALAAAATRPALGLAPDKTLTAHFLAARCKAQLGSGAMPQNAGLTVMTGALSAELAAACKGAKAKDFLGERGFAGPTDAGRKASSAQAASGVPLMMAPCGLIAELHPRRGQQALTCDAAKGIAARLGFPPVGIEGIAAAQERQAKPASPTPNAPPHRPSAVASPPPTSRPTPSDATTSALSRSAAPSPHSKPCGATRPSPPWGSTKSPSYGQAKRAKSPLAKRPAVPRRRAPTLGLRPPPPSLRSSMIAKSAPGSPLTPLSAPWPPPSLSHKYPCPQPAKRKNA